MTSEIIRDAWRRMQVALIEVGRVADAAQSVVLNGVYADWGAAEVDAAISLTVVIQRDLRSEWATMQGVEQHFADSVASWEKEARRAPVEVEAVLDAAKSRRVALQKAEQMVAACRLVLGKAR